MPINIFDKPAMTQKITECFLGMVILAGC